MTKSWDETKPGFVGDDNIYGIGIRIGYYTQAISIWVANFYARHEAPYLHTITILFLFALFVGVCQLSRNPRDTYAVEPFMLTTIAYHTLYLGLWDPEPPYRLRWETDFRQRASVISIWLAFSAFDTWYWWKGVWLMKPSNGPIGTVIFFPYVGNTPLFGPDEWVSIAAKTINSIVITTLMYSAICLCGDTVQQRKVDRLITVERLKNLTSRWLRTLGGDIVRPTDGRSSVVPVSTKPVPDLFDAEYDSRTQSKDVLEPRTLVPTTPSSVRTCDKDSGESSAKSHITTDSRASFHEPSRTGTGLLKKSLFRRFTSTEEPDLSVPPPDYILYEPSFEQINTAYDFLKDTTTCKNKKELFPGATILIIWFYLPIWFGDLFWYLIMQLRRPCRPSILLAVKTHAATLRFACQMSYPQIMRHVISHPSYLSVKSKDIVLASRIILSTKKVVKPTRKWQLIMGYAMLAACSVLIIGTELTIQWNKIQNVQNLTSVGQLIPFTLGVGSLLKILWSAVAHRGTGADEFCYFQHCVRTGGKEEWQEAGKKFLDCREADEMRRMSVVDGEGKAQGCDG